MWNFIDRFRIQIGLALVIIILIGGGILLWKGELGRSKVISEKQQDIPQNSEQLQKEIESLKSEISRLNQTLSNTEIQKETSTSTTVTEQSQTSGKVAGESTPVSGKININTADQKTLESLPGIGPTYASRIIEYRNSHGGFKSISEIQNIKGIGPKTYEKIKDLITI